jgi:hypothetical protein
MKRTISKSEFRDAFYNMGRGEQFSYEGLGALFDYLEDLEQDTREEMELDVIAICCEFAEYGTLEELAEEYDIEGDKDDIERELGQNTTVIVIGNGGIIVPQY